MCTICILLYIHLQSLYLNIDSIGGKFRDVLKPVNNVFDIRQYINECWTKIKEFPFHQSGVVYSNETKCIYILGGNNNGENPYGKLPIYKTNKIYQFNTINNQLKLLDARLPTYSHLKNKVTIINITKQTILIIVQKYLCIYTIPLALLHMIVHYIDIIQFLHLIDDNNCHWVINIKKLL